MTELRVIEAKKGSEAAAIAFMEHVEQLGKMIAEQGVYAFSMTIMLGDGGCARAAYYKSEHFYPLLGMVAQATDDMLHSDKDKTT